MARWSKFSAILLGSLVGGAVTGAPAAAGTDEKVYTGTMCESYRWGVTSSPDLGYRGGDGAIYNKTSGTVEFLCPVPRDTVGTSGDADGILTKRVRVGVQVRVRDTHPTQDVRCTLRARKLDGSHYDYETRQTSGFGDQMQVLDFSVSMGIKRGPYIMSCRLPARSSENGASAILSYRVIEGG